MTSGRKIEANRANGRKSRGPRTAEGRVRASQNARRHGLTLPVMADPALSKEVTAVAREFAGDATDPNILREARIIAVAQIELARIRRAKLDVLARHTSAAQARDRERTTEAAPTKARGKLPLPAKHASNEEGSLEALDQLLKIDRYERRVLSKRKFAIRRFDAARKATMSNRSGERSHRDIGK